MSTRTRPQWKPHKARGMCDTHYRAWKRTLPTCKQEGSTVRRGLKPKDSRQGYCRRHDYLLLKEPYRKADAAEKTSNKFVSQIIGDQENGCWHWVVNKMYPLINVGNHEWLAHRYSYNSFIGGHEPGLTLDHVCRNALCVRPDHLMPMTLLSNTRKEPLPIERAQPGAPSGFGLDGQPFNRYPGPATYPSVVELARA